jgi:hypothetical protein
MSTGQRGLGGNGGAAAGGASGGAYAGTTGAGASGVARDGAADAAGDAAGLGGTRDGAAGSAGGSSGAGGVRTRPTGSGGIDAAAGGAGSLGAWDGGVPSTEPVAEPVDDRPPRPAWSAPFTEPLGTPGWRDSTDPICDANQGFFGAGAFDVWADDRGVFALVGEGCAPDFGFPCGKDGASIKLNSGTGWQLVHQFAAGSTQSPRLWPSVPNGALLVSGPLVGYGAGTAFVDNGKVFAFQPTSNGYGAYGGFAVSSDRAYVIDFTRLLEYSGSTWSSVGSVAGWDLLAVWADPQVAIVVGSNQTIATRTGTGELTPMSGVPAGCYQAVWAFGPNDLWFGNNANQLMHYDGKKWKAYATGSRSIDGIESLWGASGVVYFTTRMEFGRWNGTEVELLLRAKDDGASLFGSVWGRSPNEVFIAIRDPQYRDTACGAAFILWFDGAQFHQF